MHMETMASGSHQGGRKEEGIGSIGPAPHTLTLFKTKIADFPTLFKTFNPKPKKKKILL